jgi:hypothetical protein
LDREQAEVSAVAADLHVDGTDQGAAILGEQEGPLSQELADLGGGDAITVDEEAFDFVGGVHEGDDRADVGAAGLADLEAQTVATSAGLPVSSDR